jgi:predicted acetyltransferase
MTIEYRSPSAEEGIVPALATTYQAFGEHVQDYDREHLPKLMPTDRIHCAFDNGRPIATAAAFAFELTIPGGGQLPTGGVTWVGVLPSHRRRGVLTELMRRQLNDLHDRGEPLAALWASESAIYGRFGYGSAAPAFSLNGKTAGFRLRDNPDPVGTVRLIEREEAREAFPPIYEQVRPTVPGMLTRTQEVWDVYRLADEEFMRHGAGPKFYALYERDGVAEGYATYRIKSNWKKGIPQSELRVIEAIATGPIAVRELWRFLFSVDLVSTVDAWLFDPGSPLFLSVLDLRRLEPRLSDGLWLRLVDVEAALRARSYWEGEPVVLEVTDELCSWNAGRHRVGGGVAERTDDAADLRLDVADLAIAYFGAFDFERLADALRVEELRPGALSRASLLFRTPRLPFCPEVF